LPREWMPRRAHRRAATALHANVGTVGRRAASARDDTP
jgi:hypothetical protein